MEPDPNCAAREYDDGVAIQYAGRRIMLKWHVLRRAPSEPPFSLLNLRTGLRLDASMEIDLRLLRDGVWVCLHDDVLDAETSGKGPVAALDSAALRRIRIAGADYAPPLLTEIVDAMASVRKTGALLQIDLKEPAASMTDRAVAGFGELVARSRETAC